MKIDKSKIRLEMARKCVSIAELKEAAGMPRPTICKALSGASVRPETIGKIAKALGVDVTEILETEN